MIEFTISGDPGRMTEFTIPGDPRGKGRARFSTKQGRAYTPKETTAYEKLVRAAYYKAREETDEKLKGAVAVEITAYFGIPSYVTKKVRDKIMAGEELPLKKPDLDNIVKIVQDALNESAYHDDKQVTDLCARKRYDTEGKGARVDVMIAGK